MLLLSSPSLHFLVQFQQSVSSEVKCLGRSSFTLCVDSPLVIRQALHPEASKKVTARTAVAAIVFYFFCTVTPLNKSAVSSSTHDSR